MRSSFLAIRRYKHNLHQVNIQTM